MKLTVMDKVVIGICLTFLIIQAVYMGLMIASIITGGNSVGSYAISITTLLFAQVMILKDYRKHRCEYT